MNLLILIRPIICLSLLLIDNGLDTNGEKVFYGKDKLSIEFIVLNANDNKGAIMTLYKDHNWFGKIDFTYEKNGDTLKIDFAEDKYENGLLFVGRNKLKQISSCKVLSFKKYHRISTKKMVYRQIKRMEYQ